MKTFYRALGLVLFVAAFAGCNTVSTPKQPVGITRQARPIVQKWIDSLGGTDALRANRNYLSTATIDYGNGGPPLKSIMWRTADGSFRNELVGSNGVKIVGAFDRINAWYYVEPLGFGLMPMNDALQTQMRGDMLEALNIEKNYRYCRDSAKRVIDDKTYVALELRSNAGALEWWLFDPETGRRVRCEYASGPNTPNTVTEFSDFRSVGAVTLPFVSKTTVNGRTTLVTLQSVEFNPSMLDVEFSPTVEQLHDAQKATQLLTRHVEAIGGMAAFARLKSRVMHARVDMGANKSRTVVSQKMPNKILVETDMAGLGKMLQGYDGKTGWVSSELQGYRTMKGPELQQLLTNVDLRTEAQLPERCPLRKWIGEKTVNGRLTQAIALARWQGPAGTYYFDDETARLVRIETAIVSGSKGVLPVTIDFSDFREVDGITMPFMTTTTNPAMRMVTTIESVENNVPLDDAIFAPQEN